MKTCVDEIADGIHRLTTLFPEMVRPPGSAFNQYLVTGDEPLLFHSGPRGMFPSSMAAVAARSGRAVALDLLWPLRIGRVWLDERLAGSRRRRKSRMGHRVRGLAGRSRGPAPRVLADGEVLDMGGHGCAILTPPMCPTVGCRPGVRGNRRDTPLRRPLHPVGNGPAGTSGDIMGPAIEGEEMFRFTSLGPTTRAHDPQARGPGATDAGADARLVVRWRRCRCGAFLGRLVR